MRKCEILVGFKYLSVVKFELRLIMCLLCKYIGARKRVKVTKRTQADQSKYFTYWAKKESIFKV
jgi:hypothetical protein